MHKTINKESSEILYVRSDKSYKAAAYKNIKNPTFVKWITESYTNNNKRGTVRGLGNYNKYKDICIFSNFDSPSCRDRFVLLSVWMKQQVGSFLGSTRSLLQRMGGTYNINKI